MSDQTIHSPAEAKGKPVLVGDRGGLKVKDEFKTNNNNHQNQNQNPKSPVAICEGPGYDIGFFQAKGGFDVKYKGPKCQEVMNRIQEYLNEGIGIKEAVHKIHLESE